MTRTSGETFMAVRIWLYKTNDENNLQKKKKKKKKLGFNGGIKTLVLYTCPSKAFSTH